MRGLHVRWTWLVLLTPLVGRAAEVRKVDLQRVPAPARAAITAVFPQARLISAGIYNDGRQELFEVRCRQHERILKVSVTSDGKIVKRAQVLDVEQVPRVLRKAVSARYRGSVINTAEQVTIQGKVSYWVTLTTSERDKRELQLNPDGKIVHDEKIGAEKAAPRAKPGDGKG